MNWIALDWSILGLPMIAGLLVLATHVPLGAQVLDRGIVFIDLAIAQIAGVGVIAADALGAPEGGLAVQVAALCAAQLGALVLTVIPLRVTLGALAEIEKIENSAAAGRRVIVRWSAPRPPIWSEGGMLTKAR